MHETLPFAGCCIYLKRREKHRKPINNLNNLIMEWIINQLRERPELAIFLTLFLGFWLGKLRIGKFSLGTVTSVLLVGVLVGQLKIDVPGPIKSVFFLLFLFPSLQYSGRFYLLTEYLLPYEQQSRFQVKP